MLSGDPRGTALRDRDRSRNINIRRGIMRNARGDFISAEGGGTISEGSSTGPLFEHAATKSEISSSWSTWLSSTSPVAARAESCVPDGVSGPATPGINFFKRTAWNLSADNWPNTVRSVYVLSRQLSTTKGLNQGGESLNFASKLFFRLEL